MTSNTAVMYQNRDAENQIAIKPLLLRIVFSNVETTKILVSCLCSISMTVLCQVDQVA